MGTLATVTSIVHHGRSRLYTSVMVAMVIYPPCALQALGMINPIATYTSVYNIYVSIE